MLLNHVIKKLLATDSVYVINHGNRLIDLCLVIFMYFGIK